MDGNHRNPWRIAGILVSAIVFALADWACSAPEPESLTDADRAAIEAVTDSALAIANSSENWVAFTDTYFAPDAVLMPPGHEAVEGRDAIAAWLTTLPPLQHVQWEVRHEEGSGGLAYVEGSYRRTVTLAEAEHIFEDYGTFLQVWRRMPDGTWKVAYLASNSTLPDSLWTAGGTPGGGEH